MSRMFVGLSLPGEAVLRVRLSIRRFRDYSPERISAHRWHITLFFLGEVERGKWESELLSPIISSFVPTVRLTHLGAGKAPGQLWAYVEPNRQLLAIHQSLRRRAHSLGLVDYDAHDDFVPHIHVADFAPGTDLEHAPDWPLLTAFSARQAQLFESSLVDGGRVYTSSGVLPLSSQKQVKA